MALETAVQGGVHSVEQGRVARWVIRVVVAVVLAGLALFWLLGKFNGFYIPDAMDQAQISRQIASGQGFTTLYARPLALRLFAERGAVPDPLPEINQPPLGPLIGATALRATGMNTRVSEGSATSFGDRVIAAVGVLFLLGALVAAYLLGRALFEPRLALLGTGLVICTALVWRFSISGLPQTAMMLLFNAALLGLVFALRAAAAEKQQSTLLWAWIGAFLLGLLTLGNVVGLCIFAGFLIFAAIALRPRIAVIFGCIAAYVLPLLPWAWHNLRSIGQPAGFIPYSLMRPAGMEPAEFQANFEPVLSFRWQDFFANTAAHAVEQIGDLFGMLGQNIAASAFFFAVFLQVFRGWQAAQMRWAVLLMWIGAFAGMSVFGIEGQVSLNQLHVLFLPVMVFYGLNFLLSLWDRLGFEQPLVRTGFVLAVFAAVAAPLLLALSGRNLRFNWPPYLPLLVQKLGDWVGPEEALASDIPWATAWYAGRRSLLLPKTVEQFELINGERLLGAPLVAVYLTPESGGGRTYGDIVAGRYRDWARVVVDEQGAQAPESWRLRSKVNLPIDGASILLTDRQRWKE
jgi:4-amino-4-deoxy-L-arabinose transferase-like glycosyltransferase